MVMVDDEDCEKRIKEGDIARNADDGGTANAQIRKSNNDTTNHMFFLSIPLSSTVLYFLLCRSTITTVR